jgi:hypothetical protein
VSAAFADTFFYVALLRVDDTAHAKAVAFVTRATPQAASKGEMATKERKDHKK